MCGRAALVDSGNGVVVARVVKKANSFLSRFGGLMSRRELWEDEALVFMFGRLDRHSVHTFFLRFPIDLVYLDSDFRVVETRTRLKPWRLHLSKANSRYLLELPAGSVSRSHIEIGHRISAGKTF